MFTQEFEVDSKGYIKNYGPFDYLTISSDKHKVLANFIPNSDIEKLYPILEGHFIVKLNNGNFISAVGKPQYLVAVNDLRKHFARFAKGYEIRDPAYIFEIRSLFNLVLSKFEDFYSNLLFLVDNDGSFPYVEPRPAVYDADSNHYDSVLSYKVIEYFRNTGGSPSYIYNKYIAPSKKDYSSYYYAVLLKFLLSEMFRVKILEKDSDVNLFKSYVPQEYLTNGAKSEFFFISSLTDMFYEEVFYSKGDDFLSMAVSSKENQQLINSASEYFTAVAKEDEGTLEKYYNVFEIADDYESFKKSISHVTGYPGPLNNMKMSLGELKGFKYVKDFLVKVNSVI